MPVIPVRNINNSRAGRLKLPVRIFGSVFQMEGKGRLLPIWNTGFGCLLLALAYTQKITKIIVNISSEFNRLLFR